MKPIAVTRHAVVCNLKPTYIFLSRHLKSKAFSLLRVKAKLSDFGTSVTFPALVFLRYNLKSSVKHTFLGTIISAHLNLILNLSVRVIKTYKRQQLQQSYYGAATPNP